MTPVMSQRGHATYSLIPVPTPLRLYCCFQHTTALLYAEAALNNVSPTTLLSLCAAEGALRIVGNAPGNATGRLDIYRLGAWGTICANDEYWNVSAAQVACQQLGYTTGVPLSLAGTGPATGPSSGPSSLYSPGSGPIWLEQVRCSGYERRLTACISSAGQWGHSGCSHSSDAGVACSGAPVAGRRTVLSKDSRLTSCFDEDQVCASQGGNLLWSPSYKFVLKMQSDCNLVIYETATYIATWAASQSLHTIPGYKMGGHGTWELRLSGGGQLLVVNKAGSHVAWRAGPALSSSEVASGAPFTLGVADNGSWHVYDAMGGVVYTPPPKIILPPDWSLMPGEFQYV